MAFDAADIMRYGKDIWLRKSATANNLALDWLRREFPDLRVHLFHCFDDYDRHADCELVPLCPPTAGKEGLVMIHYEFPILESESKIFKDNDWRVISCPPT
jgi:glycine amidinotransferase